MNETILVTGGAGYIGSHVCKALSEAGYKPVTYDNLSTGHEWAVRWGPFEAGDLASGERLRDVMTQHRPAAVIHLAANAYVGESIADPAKYYTNNVGGSLCLLNAMRETGVGRMVFSSSCTVYGDPVQSPIDESHPRNPVNPYGVTKMTVERMLEDYGAAYGMCSMLLRYFNAAGAEPDAGIGEDHDPETHLIPLILNVARGRNACLEIYGTDYDTPDGTAVRDYVHVGDLALAHVAAARRLLGGGDSDAVNLGTGRGASVLEVVAMVESVTGRPVTRSSAPRRQGDAPMLVADASRAKSVLGWTPRFSDLEDIVGSAWRWHQTHFG